MIKKVLTTRKLFLFTIIFSVFTCSICTYALKADWITNWTKVNGSPETTPIGADEEYPKIFVEASTIGGQYFENARILTKSEHILSHYHNKIDEIIRQRGLKPLYDRYYYEDDGNLIHLSADEDFWSGIRYLLYNDNKQYGLEYIETEDPLIFFMYKDETGKYVRDKWMTLDIDFDGLIEWVYFSPNGHLLQWTEKMYPGNVADEYGHVEEDIEFPESVGFDRYARTPWWYYFQNGHVTVGDPTGKLGYKVNPIGQWVDDNGVVQRP